MSKLKVSTYVRKVEPNQWDADSQPEVLRFWAQAKRAGIPLPREGFGGIIRKERRLAKQAQVVHILQHHTGVKKEYVLETEGPTRQEVRREVLRRMRDEVRQLRIDRKYKNQRSGFFGERVGRVYEEPGRVFLQANKRKLQPLFQEKYPASDVRHLGIEIECSAPKDRDALALMFLEAGLSNYVTVKTDGSVRPSRDGHKCHEINVICPEDLRHEVIPRVCRVLSDAGAMVNKSCGLHVHLDMRRNTGRNAAQAFNNLMAAQNMLMQMQPPSRRENQYCKPGRGRDLNRAVRAHRYKVINAQAYRKFNTLEVRVHSGTVQADKILNWVSLLLALVDHHEVLGTFRTPIKLLARLGRVDLLSYVMERIQKFRNMTPENEVAEAEAA